MLLLDIQYDLKAFIMMKANLGQTLKWTGKLESDKTLKVKLQEQLNFHIHCSPFMQDFDPCSLDDPALLDVVTSLACLYLESSSQKSS